MRALGVFAAGLAIDLFYVGWFRSVAADAPFDAAAYSVLIGACGLVGVTSVVKNNWHAVPWLAGLGCGTLIGMSLP